MSETQERLRHIRDIGKHGAAQARDRIGLAIGLLEREQDRCLATLEAGHWLSTCLGAATQYLACQDARHCLSAEGSAESIDATKLALLALYARLCGMAPDARTSWKELFTLADEHFVALEGRAPQVKGWEELVSPKDQVGEKR